METGYVAVRQSTQDVEEFKTYTEENPQALVPFQQATHASILPEDRPVERSMTHWRSHATSRN